MAVDYVTGLIVAMVFKNHQRRTTARLNLGRVGRVLYARGTLIMVLVAHQLDAGHVTVIRDMTCIAFVANEGYLYHRKRRKDGRDVAPDHHERHRDFTEEGR